MNQTVLLTILTLAEIALVASVFSVVIFKRYKNISRELEKLKIQTKSLTQDNPGFKKYLDSVISDTRDKLQHCDMEMTDPLEKRLLFLQSELTALNESSESAGYWQRLCNRITMFLSANASDEDKLQFDPDEDFQGFIPTLEPVAQDPDISIDMVNDDMDLLGNTMSRQFEPMGPIKAGLSNPSDNSSAVTELTFKLDEMQSTQNQLLVSVQTLEQENEHLNSLLQDRDPELTQASALEPGNTKQTEEKLRQANQKLQDMEHENRRHMEKIRELQLQMTTPTKQQAVANTTSAISSAANAMKNISENNYSQSTSSDNLNEFINTQAAKLASLDELLDFEDMAPFDDTPSTKKP